MDRGKFNSLQARAVKEVPGDLHPISLGRLPVPHKDSPSCRHVFILCLLRWMKVGTRERVSPRGPGAEKSQNEKTCIFFFYSDLYKCGIQNTSVSLLFKRAFLESTLHANTHLFIPLV